MIIKNNFSPITPEQKNNLLTVRNQRRFNAQNYLNLKSSLLNNYMAKNNLKACIVAVSGGLDSAVVLAIVNFAAQTSGIKVIPVALPCTYMDGVTNQFTALKKARKVTESLNLELVASDIRDSVDAIRENIETKMSVLNPSNWAIGQLVPYTRTPTLYYIATLLTESGFPAVIVGTTNRDEGAYLGYVGKASDGMVDLQLISDLHKSEVRSLASLLKIPREIITSEPTGDMFDGRPDEELFGTDYDSVELYMTNRFSGENADNLEKLHNYNKHKYFIGSPAVHLDIFESGVEGGWPIQFETKYWNDLKKQGDIIKPSFVSPLPFSKINFDEVETTVSKCDWLVFSEILSKNEVLQLKDIYSNGKKKDANIFGYTNTGEEKASNRASLYNIELAEVIWKRIRPHIDLLTKANDPITDWKKGEIYRAVGVNPLFRFIGYSDKGSLVPHYDYSFEDGGYKTLMSLIIYLTTNETGATRILVEQDRQKNSWNKDLKDLTPEQAKEFNDINVTKIYPNEGKALLFPHHYLHDSEEVIREEKLIIRTDIVCEKIKHS